MKIKSTFFPAIIIILVVLMVISLRGAHKKSANIKINNDADVDITTDFENAEDIVIKFTKALFKGKQEAINYTTGDVKRNLYNNIKNINSSDIVEVVSRPIIASKDYSAIDLAIEYTDANGYNVVFYRFKLINDNNEYLIYDINSIDPLLMFGNDKIVDKQVNAFNECNEIINDYYDKILKNDLEGSSKLLISNAKNSYLATIDYLDNIKSLINVDLKDFKYKNIISNNNISIIQVNYKIDNKDTNVLFSLYNTKQGWMIYDVTQI